MDLTFSPQDDPNTTERDALRHRQQLEETLGNGGSNPLQEDQSLQNSMSYGNFINSSITDPATELTEDDIFRMKKLSMSKSGLTSDIGDQFSAVSVVDSTSNYDDHANDIPYDDADSDNEESKSEQNHEIGDNQSQAITYGDFVFNRKRIDEPRLNSETVIVLQYPFIPAMVPNGENAEDFHEYFEKAKVYLVGTAHFSHESQNDVVETILATQPDAVMVELCSSRISILSMDEPTLLREAKSLNYQSIMSIIRQSGVLQGILHVLLLSTSAHITRQLGMAPGGEFRAAHNASLQVKNCRVILGDRPIQITLQRALNSLSFFQKIRLFFRILVSNCTDITQEDVERCKNKDLLEELLKEMAGEFPQLTKIFVDERDQYMTHILHTLIHRTTVDKWIAAKSNSVPFEPVVVVAVVGIGHVNGINKHWLYHIDSSELLTVPQASTTSKVIRYTVKGLVCVAAIYGVYRFGKFSIDKISGASLIA